MDFVNPPIYVRLGTTWLVAGTRHGRGGPEIAMTRGASTPCRRCYNSRDILRLQKVRWPLWSGSDISRSIRRITRPTCLSRARSTPTDLYSPFDRIAKGGEQK